jgi:hypothetical protein
MIVVLSTPPNTNLIPAIVRLIPHVKSGSIPHAIHVIFLCSPSPQLTTTSSFKNDHSFENLTARMNDTEHTRFSDT